VYSEIRKNEPVPPGFTDLEISFSVKTHTENFHVLEKGTRGTSGYVLILDIDGQTEELPGIMTEENNLYERPRTPETGNGVRYDFRSKIRVAAGYHKISIIIPGDEVAIEKLFRLEGGTTSELVLDPVYGIGKRFGKRAPNFYNHLSGIRSFQDGKLL
jgi:hypothetical protein